jgi:hypothetical protein
MGAVKLLSPEEPFKLSVIFNNPQGIVLLELVSSLPFAFSFPSFFFFIKEGPSAMMNDNCNNSEKIPLIEKVYQNESVLVYFELEDHLIKTVAIY